MNVIAFVAAAVASTTPVLTSGPITIAGGLGGTYLAAQAQRPASKKPAPQVLILVGSGPTDKDGNGPLINSNSYKFLAEGLSAAGISSTRVDKRGMFSSAAGSATPNNVFVTNLADDAHLWARHIKTRTGAPCVWLAGHSEGGLVALIAAQNPADICGLVLIATPGRKLADVMREQFRANPANAPILNDAMRAIAALEAGRDVDVSGFHPALQNLFAPVIQPFLKSLMAVDPTGLITQYKGKVLIVQGTTDLQVTMADARALAAAQPSATLQEIANVNHVLKTATNDRAANIATYTNPNQAISPLVVSAIANFVKSNQRAPNP